MLCYIHTQKERKVQIFGGSWSWPDLLGTKVILVALIMNYTAVLPHKGKVYPSYSLTSQSLVRSSVSSLPSWSVPVAEGNSLGRGTAMSAQQDNTQSAWGSGAVCQRMGTRETELRINSVHGIP